MTGDILFVLACAALAAATAFWILRAYRDSGGVRRRSALTVTAIAVLAAGGVYLALGSPGVAGEPYAARIAQLRTRQPNTYSRDEMLARMTYEARLHPNDARPHIVRGLIYADANEPQQAARAFDAALRRDPNSVLSMMGLGRALVAMDDGRVSPQAQRVFAQAGRAEPEDPTPWLYQALGATQDGRTEDARRLWRETLNRLPANDPRRAMAERMIRDPSASQIEPGQGAPAR